MKQVSLLDNVACSSTYICIYNTIYCITSTIYQGFCRICTEFTIWTTMTSNSEYNKTSKRYLMFIWRVLDHTAVYTFACFLRWIWCHKGTYGLVLKMLHMNLKQIAVLGLHRMRWRFCFFFGGGGGNRFFLDLFVFMKICMGKPCKKVASFWSVCVVFNFFLLLLLPNPPHTIQEVLGPRPQAPNGYFIAMLFCERDTESIDSEGFERIAIRGRLLKSPTVVVNIIPRLLLY